MPRKKTNGVDIAASSLLPWCACGWRELASTPLEARTMLGWHLKNVHDQSPSDAWRQRPSRSKHTVNA